MVKTKKNIQFYFWNVVFPDNLQNLWAKHCSSKTVNGKMSRMYYNKVNSDTNTIFPVPFKVLYISLI